MNRFIKLISGQSSSYLLQIANGIAPILLILYLTRYTNLSFLGNYFFIISTISIVQLIIDYGFNTSGLRSLSKLVLAGGSISEQVHLIINIVLCKAVLSISLITVYFLLEEYIFIGWEIQFICLGIIIGITNVSWILFPYNKIYIYSLILLILRVLSIGLLFYCNNSIETIILITYMPVLVTNFFILLVNIKKIKRIKLDRKNFTLIKYFREGLSIFTNSMTVSFVELSWPIYLKYFLGAEVVGVFGLADKLVRGLMMLLTPLQNFLISKNISIKKNIENHPLHIFLFIFFTILIPLSFIFIPQSILEIIFRDVNKDFRGLMNLYVFQFTFFSLMLCIYTEFIIRGIEYVYVLLLLIALTLAILFCAIYSLEMYAPFITNLIFTLLLVYKFIGIKDNYAK